MLKKLAVAAVVLVGLGVALFAALVIRSSRPVDAPYPEVVADRSAAGVARGRVLFEGTCGQCHRGVGSTRAAGAPLNEMPEFLGSFHARNLTRHPTAGIGGYEDREVARLLRYGVTRDGRRALMPGYKLSDGDLAAVLGFLRSDDPLFAEDATPTPASRASLVGRVLFSMNGVDPKSVPAKGVTAPAKAATVEYGRYLAHDVFDCAGCHTPGFSPDKVNGKELLQGGFEFKDAAGAPVRSPNLTAHATGIEAWSVEDLKRAIREGVKPNGTTVRPPMPLFRGLEDVEVEALFAYLRSVPAQAGEVPATTPNPAAIAERAARPANVLFTELGCSSCHAAGARYHEQIVGARGKDSEQLARWILHPEQFQPGTPMPSYGGVLSEAEAQGLATWVKTVAW